MIFRTSLLVVFAVGAVACGGQTGTRADCGDGSVWEGVEVRKDAAMSESEFLQGISVGGLSPDNRRSVTFISELPLCVCTRHGVNVSGRTVKTDPNADVEVSVSLISNAEATPIGVVTRAGGELKWQQNVALTTKGHGALSYGFNLLISYNFPSVGSEQDDVAELRRLISELSCKGEYWTFTDFPCSEL